MDSATAMPLFVSTGIFHGFFITRRFRSSLPKISIVVGNLTSNLLANVDTEAESFDSLRRYIACKYATSDLLKSESFNGFQLNDLILLTTMAVRSTVKPTNTIVPPGAA
jgi:hypothetical protein